ncbi:hypothetical protein BS78_05G145700 [Paspalum vaginatum]|uniref:Uncharacterized protein n=1 Tax=Paspalum vaginatum TaxID=158149 RepID=A0A9W8CC65_9POAL|nr:hypothetical protein BS78_K191700 [Paspalum vaginatum]KAJ1275567.1 hypothetical protein BS78_05G145700 [Paspalum vaginatum]
MLPHTISLQTSAGRPGNHLPLTPSHSRSLTIALPLHIVCNLARRHGALGGLPAVVASSPGLAFVSCPITTALQLLSQGTEGVVFAPYDEGWRQMH